LQVFRYCTQAYKTMVPSVTVGNIVQPTIRFVLGTALLLAGFEVAGAIVSLVVSVGISAVVAFWFFHRMMTEAERTSAPVRETGAMVRFALPQAGASLLGIQSLGLGILLLGLLKDNAAAGAFGVALSLQGPANIFLGGIVNIWAPMVSDLHEKGEIARLDGLYKTINRWIATFSFPVAAALIVEADLFTRLFGGEEGVAAAPAVAALAVGNIFYTGTGPTGYVISMTGRPVVNLINSVVAVGLYVGLGLLVVPDHGFVGMAWVDSGVTAVVNMARVVQAKWLVGVQPFGRTFYKPVVATLAGAAVLVPWSLFADDEVMLEIAGIAVGAVVYLVVLKLFGLDPEEQHVWDRIRKRAFKRGR
jgi:O-antigen/teichoic acid export membrane protein